MSVTTEELTVIVRELFDALDADKSGMLEKKECHDLALNLHGKMSEQDADAKAFNEEAFEKAFTTLDKSGDGKISFDELNGFFQGIAKAKGFLKE